MRVVAVGILCTWAMLAHAQPQPAGKAPAPSARLTPPQGRFFDDPIAISSDGKAAAALSTDASTIWTLHLWTPEATPTELRVDGLPNSVVSLAFLGPGRVLVVFKKEGTERLRAQVAVAKDGKRLVLEAGKLGPADAIEVVERDGKRAIALYSHITHKAGSEHELQLLSADNLKQIAHRTLAEDAEGLLRTHAGPVRPLWWSAGHTELAAQKIGEYDRAHDIRRPDRFVRLDVATDKPIDEHEITDVLGFAKVVLTHKAAPAVEAFVRLSDDHKELLMVDGLAEHSVALARGVERYEPASIHGQLVGDKQVYMTLQVDPNNATAIAKHAPDSDDIDVYSVERAAEKMIIARRLLDLPGLGRPASFRATEGRLLLLRKDKGFDRGGVALELYALP